MAKINREKEALISQKRLHELFEYDGATGSWVNKIDRGSRARKGQPAGGVHKSTGYVNIMIDGNQYRAHRLAWLYTYGDYPDGEQPFIDHINGKKGDNRIDNLRVSSGGENQRNQGKHSRNTSGVTGIYQGGRWNGSKTKKNWYWIAAWCDENGKHREKSFNIETHGEELAEQLAIDYRAEQLRLLEVNFGIIYSERHGT